MVKIVDITQATESAYITAELIENSPTKTLVIMPDAKYEDGKFGKKLKLNVSLDAKAKMWNPNKDTAKALKDAWGTETDAYVGKRVICEVKELGGREVVIGTPVPDVVPPKEQAPPTQNAPTAAKESVQEAPVVEEIIDVKGEDKK